MVPLGIMTEPIRHILSIIGKNGEGQYSHDETDELADDEDNGSVIYNEDSICSNNYKGVNVYHGKSDDDYMTNEDCK